MNHASTSSTLLVGSVAVCLAGGLSLSSVHAQPADCFLTSIKPYTVSLVTDYTIQPLLSVADLVPRTVS